jgi:hypothetical protein
MQNLFLPSALIVGRYKMEKDIFGFEKAIELDHLTKEELEEIAIMLGIKK